MRLALYTVRRSFTTSIRLPHHTDAATIRRHNLFISNLIRSNRLNEARHFFDSLLVHSRNVVTWNSMLSGYVKGRELQQARKLFDDMPERDLVSWNAMLSGYLMSFNCFDFEEGRKLFDEMPKRDVVSWNTMINGYVRNRRMSDAVRLFDKMPVRNVVSWNTLISGFLGLGQIERALDLFDEMPDRDGASLSALVSGLINNCMLREAEKFLMNEKMKKIKGAVDAYNTLIACYGQYGMVKEARILFDTIPNKKYQERKRAQNFEKNLVSWNSMIMCYVKAGDITSANYLFDEMPDRDLISWNTMISGYTQASQMEKAEILFNKMPYKDSISFNLIIYGYTQKGEMEKARSVFDKMARKSTVMWNTIITGYEQNGEYEEAIDLFSKMQFQGSKPDKHTLSSILGACANLAMLSLGTQIHQIITKNFIPDTPISNALITMYSKCGVLEIAHKLFDEMTSQKDVVSYNAMLAGFAYNGLAMEALNLFEEMKRIKVIKPTYITFISLLHACGHGGLVNKGKEIFNSMINEFKIAPRVEHYASLVDIIGRYGCLEGALKVINSMEILPDQAVWGAFLGACRVHKNVRLGELAFEALRKIEPNSSAPYVLLHNLHVDEGRWTSAKAVRKKMDGLGVVKHIGLSWIEVNNKVHVFVSGDTSHLFSRDIYSLLESCNRFLSDMH